MRSNNQSIPAFCKLPNTIVEHMEFAAFEVEDDPTLKVPASRDALAAETVQKAIRVALELEEKWEEMEKRLAPIKEFLSLFINSKNGTGQFGDMLERVWDVESEELERIVEEVSAWQIPETRVPDWKVIKELLVKAIEMADEANNVITNEFVMATGGKDMSKNTGSIRKRTRNGK